jgi:hypothetical protein
MTQPRPALTLIEPAALPVYPIERDERLPELAFIKWQPSRWLNSSGHLKCTYEVQGVARALFDLATAQSPIGTLPDDDEELAALLRMPLNHWGALRSMGERGPLRNWVPCLCPGKGTGEIRLQHHVVLASLQDVLLRREARETGRGRQVVNKRVQRLRAGMMAAGIGPMQADDPVLMKRLDDFLEQTVNGNRMPNHYQAAFEHAVRQGWVTF